MEFHAYHGCLPEEKTFGNRFTVDFRGTYDISRAAESDRLSDAQDTALIYKVIAREMKQPSDLIENVAARILKAVRKEFPEFESISISVGKYRPRVGGPAEMSKITVCGNMGYDGEEGLYDGE